MSNLMAFNNGVDPVDRFMKAMRTDESGNTYSPVTQYSQILRATDNLKVDTRGMQYSDYDDYDLGGFEQEAFGYSNTQPQQRRGMNTNAGMMSEYNAYNDYNNYVAAPTISENTKYNTKSSMPSEILDSIINNPIDKSVFDPYSASQQAAQRISENTRLDLMDNRSSSQRVPQVIRQQPQVIRESPSQSTQAIDYPFINQIVKDAINEGIDKLKKPAPVTLIKDNKKYEGKISQQKNGKTYFIINGGEYAIEIMLGDIKKINIKK